MIRDTDLATIALLRKALAGASEEAIVTAYYAGEHSGIARAADVCERLPLPMEGPIVGDHKRGFDLACHDCADAIRRLLAKADK